MAAADASVPTSSRSGGGGSSADSYIGSLISLTSKSEIRYEGVLYNINTEESSIGLRNVRSFGTEGRKKDGPQVPPSDKIYEYILFRGSDVKDLQVKASPSVQATPTIDSDPAIMQSNHPRPTIPTTSLPSAPTGSLSDHGAHSAPIGLSGTAFQSAQALYQSGSTLNTKDPSPPNTSGSGLAMPMMYWHGYYGATNGLPQLPQQSLFQPPPGLSVPPSMQHMQFSGFNSTLPVAGSILPNSNMPDQSSLAPKIANSGLGSYPPASSLSSNIPSQQLAPSTSETMINPLSNKGPIAAISTSPPSSSFPSLSHLPPSIADNARLPSVSSAPNALIGATAPLQTISHPGILASGASGSTPTDTLTPSLITPGQLLNPGQASVPGPQYFQTTQNNVEVVHASLETPSEASVPEVHEAQPPILPLPLDSQTQQNADGYYMGNNYRGHGRRGSGVSRPVTNFTEEFDFTAMNEKFKKDEVWGHLGKSSKPQDANDADYSQDEHDAELPNSGSKSVYNKDDFFDSISCNALDNNPNFRRNRYSEQMKLDTETFGEFSRYRGGYQGGRGGGRFYGTYRGRGYYGGGYGYGGRGRGQGMYNHDW